MVALPGACGKRCRCVEHTGERVDRAGHVMMLPLLIVIVLCALMPWTALLLPKLLVPKWL